MRDRYLTSGHHVVCGFGSLGESYCQRLSAAGEPFVVVDVDWNRLDIAHELHCGCCILGDAMQDGVLLQAGVERAKTLACFLPTDADNALVALSGRLLAADLQIISCVRRAEASKQLQCAGADHVISACEREVNSMAHRLLKSKKPDSLIGWLLYGEKGDVSCERYHCKET